MRAPAMLFLVLFGCTGLSVGAVQPSPPERSAFESAAPLAAGAPYFTLDCNPSSITILIPGSNYSTCELMAFDGFAGDVDLECDKAPAGVSCAFLPDPVTLPENGTGFSTLTLTAGAGAPPGRFEVQVKTTNGSLNDYEVLTLNLVGPEYKVDCSPSALNISTPGNETSLCSVVSYAGYSSNVWLSCASLPPGMSCAFSPDNVTPPANSTAYSSLTVAATNATPPGSHSFEVRGSDGGMNRSSWIRVDLFGPDFSIACAVPSMNVTAGGYNSTSCTASSQMNFTGNVTFSCAGKEPIGLNCTFAPVTVHLPPGGQNSTLVNVSANQMVAPGTYRLGVQGDGENRSHNVGIDVNVLGPDFTLSCAPSSISIDSPGYNSTTCNVTSLMGFSSSVSLSCEAVPTNVSCTFAPPAVTPPANGTDSSTLNVSATNGPPPGSYVLLVRGSGPNLTRTFKLDLVLIGPEFTVDCAPPQVTVAQGGQAFVECNVTSVLGYAGNITATCEKVDPPGVTCWFVPTNFSLPAGGVVSVNLTLNVSAGATVGRGIALPLFIGLDLSRGSKVELDIVPGVSEFLVLAPVAALVAALVLWSRSCGTPDRPRHRRRFLKPAP